MSKKRKKKLSPAMEVEKIVRDAEDEACRDIARVFGWVYFALPCVLTIVLLMHLVQHWRGE